MSHPYSTPSSSIPTVSAAPSPAPAPAGASNQPPVAFQTPAAVLHGQVSVPNMPMAPPRRAPATFVPFLTRQAPSPAIATVEQEEPVEMTVDRVRAAVLAEELALRVARHERNEMMEQALRQAAATGIGLHIPTADEFAATVAGRAAASNHDEQAIAALERSGIVLGASRRAA